MHVLKQLHAGRSLGQHLASFSNMSVDKIRGCPATCIFCGSEPNSYRPQELIRQNCDEGPVVVRGEDSTQLQRLQAAVLCGADKTPASRHESFDCKHVLELRLTAGSPPIPGAVRNQKQNHIATCTWDKLLGVLQSWLPSGLLAGCITSPLCGVGKVA